MDDGKMEKNIKDQNKTCTNNESGSFHFRYKKGIYHYKTKFNW